MQLGDKNLKKPVVSKYAGKNKKKIRNNGISYKKSVFNKTFLFGVTLKKITVDTCNFY